MLAAKAQFSLADAKRYFKEHLSAGDYYSEGQHIPGQWYGSGSESLGLSGVTGLEHFVRLCDNLHPQTGEQLTLRQKTTRTEIGANGQEHETANRRVFYDFTFSPPKSVSIAALVGDDTRILEAHEQAVTAALHQLQSFAATRVQKNGQCNDRKTGNIIAAVFRHDTSRALDPHLHSHCIVFNATFDPIEKQWKALQNHDMLAAQKFVENVYYYELTRELVKFGYRIENKLRGDFEIKGISPELIEKFSKRHRQIDEKTKELLAREPEKTNGNIAAIRENIAHRERPPKIRDMTLSKLQGLWNNQMTGPEKDSLHRLTVNPPAISHPMADVAEKAVTWAEEHLFERRSIVNEHDVWRHALEHIRGANVNLKDIQVVTGQRDYIRFPNQPGQISIREHLAREYEIVCYAMQGRYQFKEFCPGWTTSNPQLDDEQRGVVLGILNSTDFVTLFRGGAGTGKTFALREVQSCLQQARYSVRVIAPQRQQVISLEKEGFQNVQTISALLTRRQLPHGAVLLVDEAGQIGGKQMHAVLTLAKENDCRVILSGDTRQHGAVEASDALRAIEKHSYLQPIELNYIRRQNPALAKSIEERKRIKRYRQAVEEARDGKLNDSFNRLDLLKAIEQCAPSDLHQKLAARYLELVRDHQSTIVVSQSWNEIHKVNDEIRAALKREKLIGETETAVTTFQPVDLTAAQKRDARSYDATHVLVFNRDVRGFKAGDSAQLKQLTDMHLVVESDGRVASIPFRQLDRVTVCQSKEIPLAAGDQLQLKANGRSTDNKKLANGELVTVKSVNADGSIVLKDRRVLGKNFRQFVRGYAVTSYASQGKSVDYVLFSDSAVKAATSRQQWYVTISRGKKGINIFTMDKEQLRENITRSGERTSVFDALIAHHRNNPFFRLIERRWGQRAALTMTLSRNTRISESLRQQKAQSIVQTQAVHLHQTPKQSRGMGV